MTRDRLTIEIEVAASAGPGLVFVAGVDAAKVLALLAEHGLACQHITVADGQAQIIHAAAAALPLSDTWQTFDGGRVRAVPAVESPAVRAKQLIAPELVQATVGDGIVSQIRSPLPVGDGQVYTIGRTREGNALRVNDAKMARHHAKIVCQDGHYLFSDLASGSLTQVNDVLVTGPVTLNDGDRIRLGDTTLIFIDYVASLRAMQNRTGSHSYSSIMPNPLPPGAPPAAAGRGGASVLDAAVPEPTAAGKIVPPPAPTRPKPAGPTPDFDRGRPVWPFLLAAVVMLVMVGLLLGVAFGWDVRKMLP